MRRFRLETSNKEIGLAAVLTWWPDVENETNLWFICWFNVGVCRNMTNGDGHVKMLSRGLPCVFQICLSQLFEISKSTDWGSDQQQCVFQICLSFTVLWTILIDQLVERDLQLKLLCDLWMPPSRNTSERIIVPRTVIFYLCKWWICRLDEYIQIAYLRWFDLIVLDPQNWLYFVDFPKCFITSYCWGLRSMTSTQFTHVAMHLSKLVSFLSHRIGPKVKTI